MALDIPDEVRDKVVVEGNEAWLADLPALVDSLARQWLLTIGGTMRGGHAALVLEASIEGTTAAVLKIAVPGTQRELRREATALRLADGVGYARLLRSDLDRDALLLGRLGRTMRDLVPDPATRHEMLGDVAARGWRQVGEVDLPSGAEVAQRYAERLPRLWEETGRPCSRATVQDALDCVERRRRAHDDRHAVLVHGDVHDLNALQAPGDVFALIDPHGLLAEPAYDLGTIVRCDPGAGDDLHARAQRLASRSGLDVTAIWEWGTVHRVLSGLYSRSIGFQPFGDLLLADADRLTASG